jgi:tyrosine-protein kinase Etk/Wzc
VETEGRISADNLPESIDFDKLKIVIRKNIVWIILLFLAANLASYLTIRWTKEVYESESELKLDVRKDASDFGIKTIVDDQNVNMISGEIEQIRSKTFFNRLIDSIDINVSYYSIGQVLNYEMYKGSPFRVHYTAGPGAAFDKPVYFNFSNGNQYTLRLQEDGKPLQGNFGEKVTLDGLELTIETTKPASVTDDNNYFFIIHSRAALLGYLASNIMVEPINFEANTIKISFSDFNPQKTYDIVNKIDSVYISYSNEQKNLTNKQKLEWLVNELGQVEKKMEGFENYFENFTLQNKSSNVDDDLKKTIVMINALDSQRFELSKKISNISHVINELTASGDLNSVQYQNLPPYLTRKIEDLQLLIQDQNKLGLSYKETTFAYRQKQQQLTAQKDQVFKQLTDVREDWQKTMLELNQKKNQLERQFASMPDKSTEFTKNQRFHKLYEEFYLTMMKSKAETEIAQAGSTPDFKILSSATLPEVPKSPQKVMILSIGVVAGFILNFFFIGFLYLVNNKINSVQEIEHAVDVPVLGSIPISTSTAISPFHFTENPKSRVSESIRTLRTNLDFFASAHGKKVIAISSTISGEGKSFLAINLGGVLALSHKKVILLDLDMRKSKDDIPFEITDKSKGVSTVLIKKNKWEECIVKTQLANFDYMPSGPHPPNPSELLLNGEFSQLLVNLRKEYDFVVMDTPPVGLVTDGIMAMRQADLSIYVVRANYSKKEFLKNLLRVIRINKLDKTAIVLNALPSSGKTYGYGYYEENKSSSGLWKKKRSS